MLRLWRPCAALPLCDGGNGGKFLILPPGYKAAMPSGYFVYRSGTNNVFVFLRGFYEDPKNLTPAVAHLEQTKIYPLNGEASAKPMKFPDASGVPVNMLPISDDSAFDRHLRNSGTGKPSQRTSSGAASGPQPILRTMPQRMNHLARVRNAAVITEPIEAFRRRVRGVASCPWEQRTRDSLG